MNHKVINHRYQYLWAALSVCVPQYRTGGCWKSVVEKQNRNPILGNIYVGTVQKIVPNIRAAFIEIKPGVACYYSMEEAAQPIFVKKISSKKLVQGDELLVQVTRESVKTKAPTVSANLNVTGRYLVLTSGDYRLGFSSKLTKPEKQHYRELLSGCQNKDFGSLSGQSQRSI